MQINLKEAWLVRTMTNGIHGDTWEFKEYEPDSYFECWDASAKEFVAPVIRRIIYSDATIS